MFGKCKNCVNRRNCTKLCGIMFGSCDTDYRAALPRSSWIVNVNDAARKCLVFADALNPWDGFLSELDYADHMRNIRSQLRDSEESAWDALRETRSTMIEYDENCNGEYIEDGVREAYDDAIKALYLVIRNYWHE